MVDMILSQKISTPPQAGHRYRAIHSRSRSRISMDSTPRHIGLLWDTSSDCATDSLPVKISQTAWLSEIQSKSALTIVTEPEDLSDSEYRSGIFGSTDSLLVMTSQTVWFSEIQSKMNVHRVAQKPRGTFTRQI